MTTPRDPDAILSAWMDEGPRRLPDQTRRAIAVAIPTTSQHRSISIRLWRSPQMQQLPKLAVGAVAVVAIVLGGAFLLGSPGSGPGAGGPTPSPSTAPPSATPAATPQPSPSPVAAAPIDTSDWVAFSSDRYGYDMSYPPGWTATPAARDWSLEADRTDFLTKAVDGFIQTGVAYEIYVTSFSVPVPAGMSNEKWLAAYIARDSSGAPNGGCTPINKWEAVTVGGQPGLLNPDACDASQAFVFIGDRVHVFSGWRGDEVPLLKAFLSTVRFQPETALPSPSASPS